MQAILVEWTLLKKIKKEVCTLDVSNILSLVYLLELGHDEVNMFIPMANPSVDILRVFLPT